MLMGYDKGLAAGLLAGAVTESAAIGSASEAINRLNVSDAAKATMASNVAVAYSVTYIFGTVGATWFLSQHGSQTAGNRPQGGVPQEGGGAWAAKEAGGRGSRSRI